MGQILHGSAETTHVVLSCDTAIEAFDQRDSPCVTTSTRRRNEVEARLRGLVSANVRGGRQILHFRPLSQFTRLSNTTTMYSLQLREKHT